MDGGQNAAPLFSRCWVYAAPGIAVAVASGFFALTDSRCDDPKVIIGRALATPSRFPHVCCSWRSLPHAFAVIACASAADLWQVKDMPPFTSPDHRFFAFHYGERLVAEGGCPRLGMGTGARAADIIGFVTGSIERGFKLADVLDQTSGPVTLAVLHRATQTVIIAHPGQTLWLSRPRGDPCGS